MNLTQWQLKVEQLDDKELNVIADALATLKAWKIFREEFKSSGVFNLQHILHYEMERRAIIKEVAEKDVKKALGGE